MGKHGSSLSNDVTICGNAPHDLIALLHVGIGRVGCDNSEVFTVRGGCDVDADVNMAASDWATSWGAEGEYHCSACDEESEEETCEGCGSACEWVENENIEGHLLWFILSEHPHEIGAFSMTEILQAMEELGAAEKCPHQPATYLVHVGKMFGDTGLFNDCGDSDKEWSAFVDLCNDHGIKIIVYPESV